MGPDRTLFLPVSSVLLDGSGSSDDRGIITYRWEPIRWETAECLTAAQLMMEGNDNLSLCSVPNVSTPSGPPGVRLDGADQAVATATGLRKGRYTFRLTVTDQEGATDSTSLTVWVQEGERGIKP